MVVDPKVEKPTRKMIGHAIREEFDDLENEIRGIGNDTLLRAMELCILMAGYIVTEVAGRWPTDADVREIARHTAVSARGFVLSQDDAFAFLSRVALNGEPMPEVIPSAEVGIILPLQVASTLLLAFLPQGKHWWEYLDVIENALDAAEHADLSLLPALLLRSQRAKTAPKQ
jgi:hypothetical protein